MNTSSLLVPVLFGALACSTPPTSSGVPSAADLRLHVGTLADDAMQGRRAASAGERAAAAYLVDVLRRAGLEPGGPGGEWFQEIDVVGHQVEGARIELLVGADRRTLLPGHELSPVNWGDADGEFDIVRVTTAAELPATPSADTALLLDGGDPRASWFLMRDLPDGGRGWAFVLLGHSDTAGEPEEFADEVSVRPGAPARFWVRGEALTTMRAQRDARLAVQVRLTEGRPARNVLGVVRAEETSPHADEWVIVTAHYDHIGMLDEDVEGDRVYNGANDDASGVAVLLEWAEALAVGPAPARNVLFMPVTGEELGLLGSKFFAEHPTVPLEAVSAVVNVEMLGEPDPMIGGAGRAFLTGYELSDLGAAWAAAGVPVVADPRPSLQLFRRSDNYPFAERGVVAHTFSSGGTNDSYHKLFDEVDRIDFEHLETCAREGLRGLQLLVSGELTPSWVEAPESD